jgi:ferredoxin
MNSLQLGDPRLPSAGPPSPSADPRSRSAPARSRRAGAWRWSGRSSRSGWPSKPADGPQVRLALDRCTGCQECVRACKLDAIGLVPDGSWTVQVNRTKCSGCRRCVQACPFRAITVDGPVRTRHQIALDHLHDALTPADVPGCQVAVGEPLPSTHLTDVCPTPDLAVLRALRDDTPWVPFRPPAVDLVVEVVAPSARAQDLGPKQEVYRHLGVGAYWTVDQRTGRVTVHWSDQASWFDQLAHRTYG